MWNIKILVGSLNRLVCQSQKTSLLVWIFSKKPAVKKGKVTSSFFLANYRLKVFFVQIKKFLFPFKAKFVLLYIISEEKNCDLLFWISCVKLSTLYKIEQYSLFFGARSSLCCIVYAHDIFQQKRKVLHKD